MLAIINADVVMRDHLIPNGYVIVEDDLIKDYGTMDKLEIPEGCEVIDAEGEFVGPGLVDIHTHAGGGYSFYREPWEAEEAVKYMLERGTTTVLPTLSHALEKEVLLEKICVIQELMKRPEGANIGGFYLEGPYLNSESVSSAAKQKWRSTIRKEDYDEIIAQVGQDVRVWAVAPEREGIEAFVRDAKAAIPHVKFAVAHSEATPQQIEALMPYGLCIGTHHTNATGTIIKYPECRGVCVDEAVNYNREIYAELICDKKGVHVDPYMLRLIRQIKGDDRIVLISDSTGSRGPVPGPEYEGADDLNFNMAGEISGTKNTLNAICYNMMVHTGASVVDAFRFGSYNPSRLVGFTDRGEIKRGLRADLVIVDRRFNMKKVILKGVVRKN